MDPPIIEITVPQTGCTNECPESAVHDQVDADSELAKDKEDLGNNDLAVSEEAEDGKAVDALRRDLEQCLHLLKDAEEDKGSEVCFDSSCVVGEANGGWNSGTEINDGWNDSVECKNGWNGWGDEFIEEDNQKDDTWEIKTEEANEKDAVYPDNEHNNNGAFRRNVPFGKFPLRPGAEDCTFYMKTGTCKFGSTCKFNHPAKKNVQDVKENLKGTIENAEKPGQIECKYYLRSGGCKYGNACKFSHSKTISPASHSDTQSHRALEFNFLGLPIRLGEKECPYFMRTGSCKFGMNCRFNHPDPSVTVNNESTSNYNGGRSSISSPWSFSSMSKNTASFVPMALQSQPEISAKPDWYRYQSSVPSHGSSSAYAFSNSVPEANMSGHQQLPVQHSGFPERPDQPDCIHFLKTGDCKFKWNCKYNHPMNRIPKISPCSLNEMGLPLRPDQTICAYYSRYGICKFGPSCKFNHPIQQRSTSSTEDQQSLYLSSYAAGAPRITGIGNDFSG